VCDEYFNNNVFFFFQAIFKNKQVVLTVFDSEIADLISALDMAHMSNSYFVLGYLNNSVTFTLLKDFITNKRIPC
jgi:hypothetical protein